MAGNVFPLTDTTELVELFKPHGLYLKPIARLNISVQLQQLKEPGKSVSNWDLMEKIKKMIRPHQFSSIKVAKSTVEFVRFEAEVENRQLLETTIKTLDNNSIKIIGFFEPLKVRAAEAKLPFPTRHDWDSFFRDAKHMNEMKAGERPDTVYIAQLPCKWFADMRGGGHMRDNPKGEPSEFVLRRIFETFGDVRSVDIPAIDPYRKLMSAKASGIQTFSSFGGQELTFEAYVQYVEYIGFVKAMDAMRGMKLVHIDGEGKAMAATFKADFDRTKHLSDKSIRRRRLERERLVKEEKEREERERKLREEEEERLEVERLAQEQERQRLDAERLARRREREEKRRLRQLEKKRHDEGERLEMKIRLEERRLLLAQRKLESIRLLTELLKRVQAVKEKEEVERQVHELEEAKVHEVEAKKRLEDDERARRERLLRNREEQLRKKVMRSYHSFDDKRREIQREESLQRLGQKHTVKSFAGVAPHRRDDATRVEFGDDGGEPSVSDVGSSRDATRRRPKPAPTRSQQQVQLDEPERRSGEKRPRYPVGSRQGDVQFEAGAPKRRARGAVRRSAPVEHK